MISRKFIRLFLSLNSIHYFFASIPMVIFVGASVYVSSIKGFWYDDITSIFLPSDPSFLHMIKVFLQGVDIGFPLYYLLAWPWIKVFGVDEISIRLFSCLAVVVSYFLIYAILKRIHGFWPAIIALITVFFTTRHIFEISGDARAYGLYMAACAFGILVFYITCNKRSQNSSLQFLLFISSCAMILVHPFGILYSASILTTLIIHDAFHQNPRFKLYLSIICGWLTLILFTPAFLNISKLISDDYCSWVKKPSLIDLKIFYLTAPYLPLVLSLVALLLVIQIRYLFKKVHKGIAKASSASDTSTTEFSLMLLVCMFFLIPVVIYLYSNFGDRSVFLSRYFVPSYLAYAVLISFILKRIMCWIQLLAPSRLKWITHLLLCALTVYLMRFSSPYADVIFFVTLRITGINIVKIPTTMHWIIYQSYTLDTLMQKNMGSRIYRLSARVITPMGLIS